MRREKEICGACSGSGYYDGCDKKGNSIPCGACNGSGYMLTGDELYTDEIIDRIHKVIDEELEIARELNPQMAMGMLQVKKLINEEFGYI